LIFVKPGLARFSTTSHIVLVPCDPCPLSLLPISPLRFCFCFFFPPSPLRSCFLFPSDATHAAVRPLAFDESRPLPKSPLLARPRFALPTFFLSFILSSLFLSPLPFFFWLCPDRVLLRNCIERGVSMVPFTNLRVIHCTLSRSVPFSPQSPFFLTCSAPSALRKLLVRYGRSPPLPSFFCFPPPHPPPPFCGSTLVLSLSDPSDVRPHYEGGLTFIPDASQRFFPLPPVLTFFPFRVVFSPRLHAPPKHLPPHPIVTKGRLLTCFVEALFLHFFLHSPPPPVVA